MHAHPVSEELDLEQPELRLLLRPAAARGPSGDAQQLFERVADLPTDARDLGWHIAHWLWSHGRQDEAAAALHELLARQAR